MTLPVDHLDLVVTDLERSLDFYNGGGSGGASVRLRAAQSDAHATPYDRYGAGIHHLCFGASSREVVNERAAWLRENDVEIESGPQEYEYTPGYYAVFFYEPDGIKLEIVHRPAD